MQHHLYYITIQNIDIKDLIIDNQGIMLAKFEEVLINFGKQVKHLLCLLLLIFSDYHQLVEQQNEEYHHHNNR